MFRLSPTPPHRAKNLCRFTKELDEKLIELVCKNEVLYDANHKYYKDLNVRDDVWLAIASMVGKSVQDCKTRWRSLRDLYHRKKKDQRIGKKFRTPWEYMENMSFLENFTTEKKQQQEFDSDEEDTKIDIKQEFDYTLASNSSYVDPSVDEPSTSKRNRTQEHYCHYDNTTVLHLLKEVRDIINSHNNPISSFFDSMAKTVMQFPPAQAAEVKLKVCQIVTEMECKILEESGNYPESMQHFE